MLADSQEIWHAILLGIVQGLGEFLPISSKGHLVVAQDLLHRWSGRPATEGLDPLEMTLALHVGTLFSIVVVYWADLKRLLHQPKLIAWIVLATVPAGIVGLTLKLFFKDLLDSVFQSPLAVGCGLLVTAALLWFSERAERIGDDADPSAGSLDSMTMGQAWLVGVFQAFALVPGISRSGTTISAGLFAGLRRQAAATFSFFIAIPAIGAASVLVLKDVFEPGTPHESLSALLIGAAVSFVVGVLALRWLIRMVVKKRLYWFSWYCLTLGVVLIAWQLSLPR